MRQAVEHVEDESFAAARWQGLDSSDIGLDGLGRGQESVRLQIRGDGGLVCIRNCA